MVVDDTGTGDGCRSGAVIDEVEGLLVTRSTGPSSVKGRGVLNPNE